RLLVFTSWLRFADRQSSFRAARWPCRAALPSPGFSFVARRVGFPARQVAWCNAATKPSLPRCLATLSCFLGDVPDPRRYGQCLFAGFSFLLPAWQPRLSAQKSSRALAPSPA